VRVIAVEQEDAISSALLDTWGSFAESGRASDDRPLDGDAHAQILDASDQAPTSAIREAATTAAQGVGG
jgi:hypothetical protein